MGAYDYDRQSAGRGFVLALLTVLGRVYFDWPYVAVGVLIINVLIELIFIPLYGGKYKYLRIFSHLILPYLILALWEFYAW
jgi:ABC-type dipeptide/oligopeptide/nickel transport system permease component